MRIAIKKLTEWIHISLILAIIMPLLYSFVAQQPDIIGQNLYVKCLIIILPVVATDFAVNKCEGLFSYLLFCTLIFAATSALSWTVAGVLHQSFLLWVYVAVVMFETLFLVVSRMSERLQRENDEDNPHRTDPAWRPSFDSLKSPSFAVLFYFLAVYATAVNLNNPAVCNAALFSAAVYTVITVLHQYICETENYLALNKRTGNIPSKRIYGIGTGMLAIFLLLFVVAILPALLTVSNRRYRDIRKSSELLNIDYTELIEENEMQLVAQDPMMEMMLAQYGEQESAPPWLNILLYIVEAIASIILVAVLIKVIYETFRAFRKTADDNGDIVEDLKEINEGVRIKKIHVGRRKLTERERIRREYRRFIRRHRKERPARYESPTEIEKIAGIAESEECKELHRQYELARYRQEV